MNPTSANPKLRGRNQKHIEQYLRAQVETASPARLVVMLYDGAIRFCSMAIEAMQTGDREGQHINLLRAQNILSELMGSLDCKVGGEVAENLMRLYLYLYEQLVLANMKDQIAPIKQTLVMLQDVRETWREIEGQTAPSAPEPERSPAAPQRSSAVPLARSHGSPVLTAIPRLGDQRA